MIFGDTFDPIWGMIKLGLMLVLLIVVVILSRLKKLDIEQELAVAAIRGFCQLMILALIIFGVIIIRAKIEAKKRFHAKVEYNLLPKKGGNYGREGIRTGN